MEQISRRTVLTAMGALGTMTVAGCADDEPSQLDPSSTHVVKGDGGSGSPASGSSSTGSEGSGDASSEGGMRQVQLDSPDAMRGRWAAYTAVVLAASDNSESSRAEDGDWIFQHELGPWAMLVRFKDGKALLAGQANADIVRDLTQEKKIRRALVAGAPKWWGALDTALPDTARIGFVLGWDGKTWQGLASSVSNFDALPFYPKSQQACGEQLVMWGSEAEGSYTGSAKAAADAAMRAGTQLTAAQLKKLGPGIQSARVKGALTAAKAYEGKGKH